MRDTICNASELKELELKLAFLKTRCMNETGMMLNNGFTCSLNTPAALSGEYEFGLPPYFLRPAYLVDKYSLCPKEWLRSEGIIKSYFVPVEENNGMWLDFNSNFNHAHHVAIVISIQGINPITGMPCKDAQLEQYIEKCPKHNMSFGADRFCKECNYKWPKQNYLTTTTTPEGLLWIDGFRSIDGIVRQYILTQEKMRGVASNIIGKDRVYAIGLSFFISKEQKPPKPVNNTPFYFPYIPKHDEWDLYKNWEYKENWWQDYGTYNGTTEYKHMNLSNNISDSEDRDVFKCCTSPVKTMSFSDNSSHGFAEKRYSPVPKIQKLEVAAGAKIKQQIYDDTEDLNFWKEKPEAIICINYTNIEHARSILDGEQEEIEGSGEGYLHKIPKGN